MLGEALAGKSQRERDRVLAQAEREMWSGTDPSLVGTISDVMTSLLGEEIALRVLPCGRQYPEYSFGGVLLNRSEYLQKEREALFSRFGSFLSGWTFVLQIETVPYEVSADSETSSSPEPSLMRADEQVSRAGAEQMALDLMGHVEQIGFSEGPRWPSITITPLGIYRVVPPAH
jgi:hypothetical protein